RRRHPPRRAAAPHRTVSDIQFRHPKRVPMTSPAVSPLSDVSADKAAQALYALLDLSKELGPEFDLARLLEVIAGKARETLSADDDIVRALERYDHSLRLAGEIQMRMLPSGTVVLP